jgi:hypothetical protein
MLQSRTLAALLIVFVSVPGFLVGHKLRHGDPMSALVLLPLLMILVLVASALMRQDE